MEPKDRQVRIAFHEAGHAVLHFVLGRPIEYVVAEPDRHETKPVAGTALEPRLEAILWVCGLSTEEEWLRTVGREDDVLGWLPNSGAMGDYNRVAALYDQTQIGDAEQEADRLVERYWPTIAAVADALLQKGELTQADVASIAESHNAAFGEALDAVRAKVRADPNPTDTV